MKIYSKYHVVNSNSCWEFKDLQPLPNKNKYLPHCGSVLMKPTFYPKLSNFHSKFGLKCRKSRFRMTEIYNSSLPHDFKINITRSKNICKAGLISSSNVLTTCTLSGYPYVSKFIRVTHLRMLKKCASMSPASCT